MNAVSQDQVPQEQASDDQTLPTIGEFLAAVGAKPVVVHPEYPGVPVVLLDIPGDWHEVAREVLPNAFGAWALPAEEGSVAAESGWVQNAVLMVWRLSLPVDPRAVMRCGYTDSRRLEDWAEIGGDVEDYDGFPSAEISGTYSYAGLSLWMSTRYLIASTPTGQYLLQLTVTTFADEIDEGMFIAESFMVQVPPARPGLGAHDLRTGPQPVVSESEYPDRSADSEFRSGMYDPEPESRWRRADSGESAESFVPGVSARQGGSGSWSESYDRSAESRARRADSEGFGVESGGFESSVRDIGSESFDLGFESYDRGGDSSGRESYGSAPESYDRGGDFGERESYESETESRGRRGGGERWSEPESYTGAPELPPRRRDARRPHEDFEPESVVFQDNSPLPEEGSVITGPQSAARQFEPPSHEQPATRPRSGAPRNADMPVSQQNSADIGSHAVAYEFESPTPDPVVPRTRSRSDVPGTGQHSVVREFDSVVFEQESGSTGFDTPGHGYESYGDQRDSRVHRELSDPDSYSTIMGIEPPPAATDRRAPYSGELDTSGTGDMDFRI